MWLIVFLFGLIVGSFLNAVIHRLHTGQSIVNERSGCPKCGHELAPSDLIPLVSFLFLRGKCRYCGKSISWQYPAVEFSTAVLFLVIYYRILLINFELFFYFAFASLLVVIFVYDLKHYLILDKVVFPAVVLAVVFQIWSERFLDGLWGAIFLSGFFAFLYFVSKGRWIGFGDVKLGLFLGFLVPFPETLALFMIAYVVGAVVSIFLMLIQGKQMKDSVPFGTFLTAAAFIAMIWGGGLIQWYFNLIGLN